jgi:glycine betaine/proline transport system permease protein
LNIFNPSHYAYIPVSEWVEKYAKEWLFNQRPLFKKISIPIDNVLNGLDYFLNIVPLPVVILFFVFAAFKTNGIRFAIFTFISLVFIDLVDIWEETMTTMAMIITAVLFCSVIGIPVGILASRSKIFEKILRPILDVMQTIPSFVYLIPVVMLFGIEITPGVIAIIIFSIAPVIRLTNLGLRQVEQRFVSAAKALGCNKWLILYKIELPLALKTIMAGVNQTLMLSLSMAVIAALIGAGGLGLTVYVGLGRLDIGQAFVGGVGIVLIAIIFDRISQKFL